MAQPESAAVSLPRHVVFPEPAQVETCQVGDPVLAGLLAVDAPAFEAFRRLRARVRALADERPLPCLGLVSATPGEGTTTMALGLAAALAQEGHGRVLLVEAGVRRPALEGILGLPAAPGLNEWLDSAGGVPVFFRRLEPFGFALVAAGSARPAPGERLGSERMRQFLTAARDAFDFVVVDCPALEATADSLLLQELLDGLLVVVRARHASRETIRRACAHLRPDLVRGVVLNDRGELLARWLERRRGRANA